jgi:hypothetical protein
VSIVLRLLAAPPRVVGLRYDDEATNSQCWAAVMMVQAGQYCRFLLIRRIHRFAGQARTASHAMWLRSS